MKEIAVYGKGGIGKSTLTANISAALASNGGRVLQIGCDPKHDSTRLLMHGERINTVLDYIRDTPVLEQKRSDVLSEGYLNIGCVEAGGPKPGVGCAGRGIITAFELLEKFHIKSDYDYIMYDVLGDVVCGGFAVPIRREYANEILVVTSGEYMSIYAANNILRGIANYDTGEPRVAGILYNSRNVTEELDRVRKFAGAVGLPIFAAIPRSDVFAECERMNATVTEMIEIEASDRTTANDSRSIDLINKNDPPTKSGPKSMPNELEKLAEIFDDIAAKIKAGVPHYKASPMTDEELETLIMGTTYEHGNKMGKDTVTCDPSGPVVKGMEVTGSKATASKGEVNVDKSAGDKAKSASSSKDSGAGEGINADSKDNTNSGTEAEDRANSGAEAERRENSVADNPLLSKNVIRNEPLHGCAFNGAVGMGAHIKDAVVLMHAPKSCAYLSYQTVTSTGRRALYERGGLLTTSLAPNMQSTNMTEGDMVFGGTDKLEEKVRDLVARSPRAVIVISSCPAGIIGDDIDRVKALATPGCPVYTVKTDGNLTGDYLQGMLMTYTSLAEQIIDTSVKQVPDTVNIVFEKVVLKNGESNFRIVKSLLSELGISVNCRFLYDTCFDDVKNYCRATLDLLAYTDYTGNILKNFFEDKFDRTFYNKQFPVGFNETSEWLSGIAKYFDEKSKARLDEDEDAASAKNNIKVRGLNTPAFGKEKTATADAIIKKAKDEYDRRVEEVRPLLEGKTLFIVTFNHELDWILGAAIDCGVKILKVGVLNFSQDEGFRTSIPEMADVEVVEDYDRDERKHDIERLEPDIVLGNYEADDLKGGAIFDTIPMCPDIGFFSGIEFAARWAGLMQENNEGDWHNDRKYFEKYYE